MKYEDLKNINKDIKQVKVKRKLKDGTIKETLQTPIQERINAFRKAYPNGAILTEIKSATPTEIYIKAIVFDEDGHKLGSGHACERVYANKVSPIENAETQAVGRALGMAGFGIASGLASYEEIIKAIEESEAGKNGTN